MLAYAHGLNYGAAYASYNTAPLAATYAAAPAYAAVPAYAAAPAYAYAAAHHVATNYALPPVQTIAEAPIVEQVVEPVEQWGYKVAY